MYNSSKNEKILLLYIYMVSILNLGFVFFTADIIFYLRNICIILLSIYTLYVNKLKFNYKFLLIFSFITSGLLLNIVLVSYKEYVAIELVNIFINFFIPMYIILLKKINYDKFVNEWYYIAKWLSFLLPLYLYLYLYSHINYSHIGNFTYLNIIILSYFYFVKKDRKRLTLFLLFVNTLFSLLIGSRLIAISSVLSIFIMIIFFEPKKDYHYYIRIILLLISTITFIFYLENILLYVLRLASAYNIRLRNISLLIDQISNIDNKIYLSGREEIYRQLFDYIKKRFAMPGGVAVTRVVTNGEYYHAHNIILEFLLVFGLLGSVLIALYYGIRIYKLRMSRQYNETKYTIMIIILISYLIRAIGGTYFLEDSMFIISSAILITSNNKPK